MMTSLILPALTAVSAISLLISPIHDTESVAQPLHLSYAAGRPDTVQHTEDTVSTPMLGATLRYGLDTTISPCVDFYQYVNGDWRARTRLEKLPPGRIKQVSFFSDTWQRVQRRLDVIIDSAYSVRATTPEPDLKVLVTFYESCLVADSLEGKTIPGVQPKPKHPPKDSTRQEQCHQRTINYLGGLLGQLFVREFFATDAVGRMEELLQALRTAIIERLKVHPLMTDAERTLAIERIQKLHLRVGFPDTSEMVDYAPLVAMLTKNYAENKKAIVTFFDQQWVSTIGANVRERWKAGLLTPNAFYMPSDHAIEIPAVMFMSPFFDVTGEDALNFGGIGMVIGHEIFHSLTSQLKFVENPEMAKQIEQFKAFNSTLGSLDGWSTNGTRTYHEDVADLGGVLVAYSAWKATLKARGIEPTPLVDGFTPDQRFFLAVGRIWRTKWGGGAILSQDAHAAPFARVNAMVMQSPAFAAAFGCKEGDPMVLPKDRLAQIW